MGATRKDIRRAVGVTTGEVQILRATDAGTTSTFPDVVHLLDREDNAPSLIHRLGYFSGGTADNLGHECRITGFTKSGSVLTFQPPAPSTPAAGDELEVWSNWTRFGGITALHLLINEGIAAVALYTGPQVYDDAQDFTSDSPELAIPSTWCEFGGADRQDHFGRWHPIPPQQLRVRHGLRTVEVMQRGRRLANAYQVRLWGYEPAGSLQADSDETPVDREWLIQGVSAALRLGLSWRASDRAAEERISGFWAGRALDLRRKIGFSRPGMGISLPV